MPKLFRLVAALSALLAGALLAATAASTQAPNFPTRPVTLIVPWPAGGTTDVTMRALASATEKHLGQPIVIENRPGAGGVLGPIGMAGSAAPDGYTVAQIPITIFRTQYMRKTPFDAARDLTYIMGLAGYTFGVAVRADAPWKTFRELIDYAKANPGAITYGTPGAGTSLHITMEQIAKKEGLRWTHVPFKGSAENLNSLVGGHINSVAESSGWTPLVQSGQLRLLVVWGAGRMKTFPDVPTLREIGIDMVSNSPFGLAGPKGMDPGVVKVLHDAFRKGMREPAYLETLAKFDQEEFYLDTAAFHAFAMTQMAEQKQLVEELGLKSE